MEKLFFRKSTWVILLWSVLWSACKPADKELLLGKWQCERDWFHFHKNMTYDSGKDDIQMVRAFRYTIDPAAHTLNLYTDDPNSTYYLVYQFSGSDTLLVRNAMNKPGKMIPFVRVK